MRALLPYTRASCDIARCGFDWPARSLAMRPHEQRKREAEQSCAGHEGGANRHSRDDGPDDWASHDLAERIDLPPDREQGRAVGGVQLSECPDADLHALHLAH